MTEISFGEDFEVHINHVSVPPALKSKRGLQDGACELERGAVKQNNLPGPALGSSAC